MLPWCIANVSRRKQKEEEKKRAEEEARLAAEEERRRRIEEGEEVAEGRCWNKGHLKLNMNKQAGNQQKWNKN